MDDQADTHRKDITMNEDWIEAAWRQERQQFCDEIAAHMEDDIPAGSFDRQHGVLPLPALIVITMEDELLHTDEHPYCDDPDCPCREELADREAQAERRYIEAGMTERYDSLP
jgi:hypothetical protein